MRFFHYCLFLVSLAQCHLSAGQNYADGTGTSPNQKSVLWLTWDAATTRPVGSSSAKILAGNYTWQFTPYIRATATVGNIVNISPGTGLKPYTPGSYFGDGLDKMYKGVKGNGILDSQQTSRIKFDISVDLQAWMNGGWNSIPFPGTVFGDAESMADSEYIKASCNDANVDWQVFDFYIYQFGSPYTRQYFLTWSNNGKSVMISVPGFIDDVKVQAVFFAKNAKNFTNVELRGRGLTAVGIGLLVPFDFGDAPATYGEPAHYMGSNVTYGNIPKYKDTVYTAIDAPLLSLTPFANIYLGKDSTDPDGNPQHDSLATKDNKQDKNDEDGFDLASQPVISSSQTSDVVLTVSASNKSAANATLYGWIDFDRDGKFGPKEIATASVPAGGNNVPITLTFLHSQFGNIIKAGPTYARFRITATNLQDSAASLAVDERSIAVALDGEVEDYKLNDIVAVKFPPVALNDNDSTAINIQLVIPIQKNDTLNAPSVTVNITNPPTNGTVSINANGTVTYTPNPGFTGVETFSYTLTSSLGLVSNTAIVTVTVKPVGVNDLDSLPMNTPKVVDVKANDGVSGNGNMVSINANPSHGSAVVNPDGTVNYTPDNGFAGKDTFSYQLVTPGGISSTPITVVMVVKPVGQNDRDTTLINTPKIINVKNNDGPTLQIDTVKINSQPAHGIATLNPDGSVTYTPTNGYVGRDTFYYTLTTPDGVPSAPILVVVAIKPNGLADKDTTGINTPIAIPVKQNDGPGGNGSTVAIASNPVHGTAAVNPDGTVQYVPTTDYTGKDTLTYLLVAPDGVSSDTIKVIVYVLPNGQPDTAVTYVNTQISVPVKGNDGPSGGGSTVTIGSSPINGTVVVNPNGTVTFTPVGNFVGTDSFTYILTTPDGVASVPVKVYVTVLPKSDLTIKKELRSANPAILGQRATFQLTIVNKGPNAATGVVAKDTLASNLSDYQLFSVGLGTAVFDVPTRILTWNVGNLPVNQTITLIYSVKVGLGDSVRNTAWVTGNEKDPDTTNNMAVLPPVPIVRNIPVGVRDTGYTNINTPVTVPVKNNDGPSTVKDSVKTATPPTHGTATVNPDGTINYVPQTGYTGKDTLTYTITDSLGKTSQPITVIVIVAPTPVPDTALTYVNTSVIVPVKSNDGPSGVGNTVSIGTNPVNGSPIVNSDGTITYNPNVNFVGTDSFTYMLITPDGVASVPIKVYITVLPKSDLSIKKELQSANPAILGQRATFQLTIVNKGPNAATGVVAKDTLAANLSDYQLFTVSLGTAVYDVPTRILTWNVGNLPVNQTVTLVFSAKVGLGDSVRNTAWVKGNEKDPDTTNNMAVLPPVPIVRNIPVGVRDTGYTNINTPVTVPVKNNDGPSSVKDTVKTVTPPTHGTATVNPDGTLNYVPQTGYTGKDTLTYTLTDSLGTTSLPVTVILIVAPIPVPDTAVTYVNTSVSVPVKSNDGPSGVGNTVSIGTNPVNGSPIVNPDGTINYTPIGNFVGTDSFTYILTTPDGVASVPIKVYITVLPKSDLTIKKELRSANPAILGQRATFQLTIVNKGPNAATGVVAKDTLASNLSDYQLFSVGLGTAVFDVPTRILTWNVGNLPVNQTITLIYSVKVGLGDSVRNTAWVKGNEKDPDTTNNMAVLPPVPIVRNIPVGVRDSGYTTINTPVTVPVKNNDGPSSVKDTVKTAAPPTHGTATVNPDGTINYVPQMGYTGKDTLTYTITDSLGTTSLPVTVIVIVAPTPVPDTAVTYVNTSVSVPVKSNDGPSGVGNAVSIGTNPVNGSPIVNSDGTITYNPNVNFVGTDSFTYILITPDGVASVPVKVYVTVLPKSDLTIKKELLSASPATAGQTATFKLTVVNKGPSVATGVIVADTLATNLSSFAQVSITSGTAVFNTANRVITWNLGSLALNQTAALMYNVFVGNGDSLRNTAWVKGNETDPDTTNNQSSIPPVLINNPVPTGVRDSGFTVINVPVTIPVRANDGLPSATDTVKPATPPLHGTITVGPSGTLNYVPVPGYIGRDSLTYTLTNALGNVSAPITVIVIVRPTGNPDEDTTVVNTPVVVPVKNNDGASGTNGTVGISSVPSHGIATTNPDGTITYTPIGGYTGKDTFYYSLTAPDGTVSAPISVAILVTPLGITGQPDSAVTSVNLPVIIPVKNNDGSGAALDTVKIPSNPQHGTVVVGNNGAVTYTPTNGYSGADSFYYTLTAPNGTVSPPIKVYVMVALTGVPDRDTTEMNVSLNIPIKRNDGPGTVYATVTVGDTPLHGTVVINGNGVATYVPDNGYVGLDSFTYILTAPGSGAVSAPIKVNIVVLPASPKKCDLFIQKVLETPKPISLGQEVTFKLIASNNGPNDATKVTITDILASNLGNYKLVDIDAGKAVYDAANRKIVWSIDGLAQDQIVVMTFKVTVDSIGTLFNAAWIKGNEPDPDSTNNYAGISPIPINPSSISIPNVITPNGDGKNDLFVIQGLVKYPGSKLSIFNRWDNLVYTSNDYNNDWDARGLATGTYFYVLKLKLPDGKYDDRKGWIMLLK